MEHDFFDMYLEEMRDITPLDRDEKASVLEGTARGDAGARSRLVEGCLREVLEMVTGIRGQRATLIRFGPGGQYGPDAGRHRVRWQRTLE